MKTIGDPQHSEKEIALYILLKYRHVSAVEGAPDGSSEDISTFKLEIKRALEVAIELQLKMVHLLVKKSSQNKSIKGELEDSVMLILKVHLRFYFKKHEKLQKNKKIKKKNAKKTMHLTLELMVHLTMQSRVHF